MNVNQYRHPDFFRHKYGRKPKAWTIKMVHDLWIKAKERTLKRRKDFCDHIDKVFNELEPNSTNYLGENEYRVYYNAGERIMYYQLTKSKEHGYSFSHNSLEFKTRDDKLSFLISHNEKSLELGNEMRRLERLRAYQDNRVKSILDKMIETYVQNNCPVLNNEIEIVNISGINYHLKVDKTYGFKYVKCTLLSEVKPSIKIPEYI